MAIGSAMNLHHMAVAIVSLTRIVAGGVAIHAARMTQYGHNTPKRSSGGRVVALRKGIPCQKTNQQDVSRSHVHDLTSAAFTRSGVKGRVRRRTPVASKIALPIAAGATVIAVSPAPSAGTPVGATSTHSIVGIS